MKKPDCMMDMMMMEEEKECKTVNECVVDYNFSGLALLGSGCWWHRLSCKWGNQQIISFADSATAAVFLFSMLS